MMNVLLLRFNVMSEISASSQRTGVIVLLPCKT